MNRMMGAVSGVSGCRAGAGFEGVALSAKKVEDASGSLRGFIGGHCSPIRLLGVLSNFEIGRD